MQLKEKNNKQLSVIMPCLNEENTVGICVDAAFSFIRKQHIDGEVIVVDNGSTDASSNIAFEHGAMVVDEERPGYGRAIRTGIEMSHGSIIVICDCDTTYDMDDIKRLLIPMESGMFDVMIGNRFAGAMEKGAMPFSHKVGVRALSAFGRHRYGTDVVDFHSGIRGLTREAVKGLEFSTDGMEFATEFIAESAKCKLRIGQTAVSLKKCNYERSSKLNAIRDGMRHLRYISRGK
ncbi:MAG: glycosyltransferase family 2 protein [Lachnospiraceae bacterium]|nr:glycosyltransferase family 2 protein [Lachnospiraceae bacterium]